MISAYYGRLLCLCFAAFFLLHLWLGLMAAAVAPFMLRLAGRMPSRAAARLLFALRLAPTVLALYLVLALCVPSYLAFEPEGAGERMGLLFLGAACLGMLAWMLSSMRAVRALVGSFRFARECRRVGRTLRICVRNEALVVESQRVLLALSGVVAPRVLISSAVLGALSPGELDVALCHEHAHRSARDNFKRLLILLAPDVVPFRRLLARLEDGWASFAEWSADDEASRGNPQRALALAGALVRIARIGPGQEVPLLASLTAGGRHLEARVERLLHLEGPGIAAALPDSGAARLWTAAGLTAAASGCLAAAVLFLPAALSLIYRLLEDFVH